MIGQGNFEKFKILDFLMAYRQILVAKRIPLNMSVTKVLASPFFFVFVLYASKCSLYSAYERAL